MRTLSEWLRQLQLQPDPDVESDPDPEPVVESSGQEEEKIPDGILRNF